MQPRDSLRATLVAVIWGANFVVIDEGLKGFPPFLLLAARFLLVAFPLILFVPRPAPWRQVLLIGAFMNLGQFVLVYLALHLGMPAGLASLLLQVQVMFTIVISHFALKQRATPLQFSGVLIGLAGLGVVVLGRGSHATLLALLVTVAAALSWAVGNVIARHAQVASGFGMVVWSSAVVPIPALLLAVAFNGSHAVAHAVTHVDLLTIASTLYSVIGSSLYGYASWNSLLSRYPVAAVVPFTLLVPVAGIASSWIVLGQVPTVAEAAGGVLLMVGVATATLQLSAVRQAVSAADRYR